MNARRFGDVLVKVSDDVVSAVLDRPEVKNAINDGVIDGLQAAVSLAGEQRAKVLVIRGAGGTFCSGADLVGLEAMRADPERVEKFMARLGELLDRIESASFATVAVVEGYAVAGGCELLLACDIVVTATTARIGDRHVEYGLVPAAGGSVRLSRRLTPARANYLLLTGELLTGDEAATWGLATFAVNSADLDTTVDKLVVRLSARGTSTLTAVKRLIGNAHRLPGPEALQTERAIFSRHLACDDAVEGLSAFRRRRRPVFS